MEISQKKFKGFSQKAFRIFSRRSLDSCTPYKNLKTVRKDFRSSLERIKLLLLIEVTNTF